MPIPGWNPQVPTPISSMWLTAGRILLHVEMYGRLYIGLLILMLMFLQIRDEASCEQQILSAVDSPQSSSMRKQKIPSKKNPPPLLIGWLKTFQVWFCSLSSHWVAKKPFKFLAPFFYFHRVAQNLLVWLWSLSSHWVAQNFLGLALFVDSFPNEWENGLPSKFFTDSLWIAKTIIILLLTLISSM